MRQTVGGGVRLRPRAPRPWRLLFGNTAHGDPEIDAAAAAGAPQIGSSPWRRCWPRTPRRAGVDPAGPRAEAMVEMLIAALRGGAEWGQSRPDLSREELVEAALDLLWTGLGNLR